MNLNVVMCQQCPYHTEQHRDRLLIFTMKHLRWELVQVRLTCD